MTQSETKPHDVEQADLDDALDDTFPASDPPSQTDPTQPIFSSASLGIEMNGTPIKDAVMLNFFEVRQTNAAAVITSRLTRL